MKILLVNKYHYVKGGADSVFFNTQRLLEEKGHEVIPFCTKNEKNIHSEYERYFVNAPEIRELNWQNKLKSVKRFLWNDDAATQIEKVIIEQKPDIAHLHNIFNGLSFSILPVLKKYGIPVVITMHDTRFICPSSYFNTRGDLCQSCLRWGGLNCGLHKCYQDNTLNSWMCALEMMQKEKLFSYNNYIDQYIFVSNKYHQYHGQRHAWFTEKGRVLYNFMPDGPMKNCSKEKGKYILYYGRITEEKGIKTLVACMEGLPQIQLIVAGTGPLQKSLEATRLPNVKFVGFKNGEDLFNLVCEASFVVVPSEWEENNPLTVIEAYFHGKPVIGSRIGGIPEIIEDNRTGFVFDAFSKESLTAAIKLAMSISDEKYAEMSEKARKFAEEHFSPENHYEKLMEIYHQVIEK